MFEINQNEIAQAVEGISVKDKIEAKCKTTKDALSYFMDAKGYKIEGDFIRLPQEYGADVDVTFADIKTEYMLWCEEHNVSSKFMKDSMVSHSINSSITDIQNKKKVACAKALMQGTPDENAWNILQQETGWSDLDIIVLKSWMWNVKITALKGSGYVKQVPMPVLFSTLQGTGKSTFTRWLYSIIKPLSAMVDVSRIQDSSSSGLWSQLLVADFDELAGMQKTEMTTFKTWYTKEEISYRKIFTDINVTVRKITQCIGSSNKPISEVVWDTTGNRRMWQIECKPELWKVTQNKNIKIENLWASIDINKTCPMYVDDIYEKIAYVQQNETRHKSDLELFIEEYMEQYIEGEDLKDYTFGTVSIYEAYKEWCASNGCKPVKRSTFMTQLETILNAKSSKGRFKFPISGNGTRINATDFITKRKSKPVVKPTIDTITQKTTVETKTVETVKTVESVKTVETVKSTSFVPEVESDMDELLSFCDELNGDKEAPVEKDELDELLGDIEDDIEDEYRWSEPTIPSRFELDNKTTHNYSDFIW